ncbi:MAG: hypothetical protein ER33_08890 [Cyanobium sp. CACIAM 14]|nr:MAG: hypothetical protein ER33_08890 [Cyanobium sp. CACIAM 14]
MTTTNVAEGTRFYWAFSGSDITSGDVVGSALTGDGQVGADGTLNVFLGVARDNLIESDELMELRFYADSTRSQQVGATTSYIIKDAMVGNPTDSSDSIIGTAAADILRGVPTDSPASHRGKGTVDLLTGNGGPDLFVLGDALGPFYDDGNPLSQGRGDFAVITDFSVGDRIQLHGSAQQYLLGNGTYQSKIGVFIYARNPERPISNRVSFYDEAIGFLEGANLSQLNLSSTDQFQYTDLALA